jgi:hypothetical protein
MNTDQTVVSIPLVAGFLRTEARRGTAFYHQTTAGVILILPVAAMAI